MQCRQPRWQKHSVHLGSTKERKDYYQVSFSVVFDNFDLRLPTAAVITWNLPWTGLTLHEVFLQVWGFREEWILKCNFGLKSRYPCPRVESPSGIQASVPLGKCNVSWSAFIFLLFIYSPSTTTYPSLGVGRTRAYPDFPVAKAEFILKKSAAN